MSHVSHFQIFILIQIHPPHPDIPALRQTPDRQLFIQGTAVQALPAPAGPYQHFQGGHTSADHPEIGFNSRPDPKIETLPGDIVCLIDNVVNPISAHDAGDDDDAAEAEEDHESDALNDRQAKLAESWHWKNVNHDIDKHSDDSMAQDWWTFGYALTVCGEEVPIFFAGMALGPEDRNEAED